MSPARHQSFEPKTLTNHEFLTNRFAPLLTAPRQKAKVNKLTQGKPQKLNFIERFTTCDRHSPFPL